MRKMPRGSGPYFLFVHNSGIPQDCLSAVRSEEHRPQSAHTHLSELWSRILKGPESL